MKFVILILASLLLSSCTHVKSPTVLAPPPGDSLQSEPMKQQIEFTTDDGVVIVGNWYPVEGALRVVLLLHMMPATKESWETLVQELNRRDIAALAIDLRGHGESTKKGVGLRPEFRPRGSSGVGGRETENINFQRFSDAEHQESIKDVRAAVTWLTSQGFDENQVLLVGASIGANLSLVYASEHPEVEKVVLLSPGLDYHGVKTESALAALPDETVLFMISARGDAYAATSSERLKELRPTPWTMLTLLDGSLHGTDLFDDYPELISKISDFLKPLLIP